MGSVRITVRAVGITVERLVAKVLGGYVPRAVERTIDANPGLAALPDLLPVGTVVVVPTPTAEELAARVEPIRLVD